MNPEGGGATARPPSLIEEALAAERAARLVAERALERTARLQAVAAALAEARDPAAVVAATLSGSLEHLGAVHGEVALLGPDGCLSSVGGLGLPADLDARRGSLPDNALGPGYDVIWAGEPLFFPSPEAFEARYPDLAPITVRVGSRALAVAPLFVNGAASGAMILGFPEPREFPEDDRAFIFTLARLCGPALERARLGEAERAAHRRAEESLALLDAYLETAPAPLGLAFFDGQLRYLKINEALARLNGPSAADHIGRTVAEVMGDYAVHLEPDLRRVLQTGRPVLNVELAGMSEADEPGWWLASYYPVRDAAGAVVGVGAVVLEVTERRRAEERLRASEAQFRLLGETLPLIVSVARADGQVAYVNPYWQAFSGRTTEDFVSGDWRDAIHPDDQATVLEAWGRAVARAEPYEYEFRARAADGRYRWLLARGLPALGPDGGVTHWINSAVDIEDRKEAEAVLAATAERDAFLVRLADTLRPLTDPAEVQAEAVRVLGEHLGANRVFYASIEADGDTGVIRSDHANGIPSGVGRHSISAFAPELVQEWRVGRTTMTPDVNVDPRFTDAQRAAYASVSSRAAVGVPLLKGGRLVALLGINHSTPRVWTPEEVALAEETAERTWAAVERARAEEALRASEERLQRMVNVPRVGVLTFDRSGALLGANDAFLGMVGFERLALKAGSFTWRDFTPEEHVGASERIMEQLRETGRGGPYEKEYLRKDGSRLWMMFVGADVGDGTIVEYAVDISDRKRAEAALEAERARFQAILEQMPAGVAVADATSGRLEFVNMRAARLIGSPLREGTPLDEVRHPGLLPGGRPLGPEWPLARALRGEAVEGEEIEVEAADGRRVLLSTASPVRDREGRIVAAVEASQDITELRETEAQAGALRRRLENLKATLENIRAGGPLTPERFVEHLGAVYHRLGRTPLEGRFAGLLLLREKPVSLTEAARRLGVTKAAISKLATDMTRRGDIKATREYTTREHRYELADESYLRDLKGRRSASWYIALLCRQLLDDVPGLPVGVLEQLRSQGRLHAEVAADLERALASHEASQEEDVRRHLKDDWDAVPPRPSPRKPLTIKDELDEEGGAAGLP